MLGSTDIITNAAGSVVAQMSFDAFGKRRNLLTLADLVKVDYDTLNALTTQGFTGHEMVDDVGVIHMGGRIYDPKLARFMSADPIVQNASVAQNLNRYSYALNSPLSYTDPSGFAVKPDIRADDHGITIETIGSLSMFVSCSSDCGQTEFVVSERFLVTLPNGVTATVDSSVGLGFDVVYAAYDSASAMVNRMEDMFLNYATVNLTNAGRSNHDIGIDRGESPWMKSAMILAGLMNGHVGDKGELQGFLSDVFSIWFPAHLASNVADAESELNSQDQKAFEALAKYNPLSIRENREYGGYIYRNRDGTFDFTSAEIGDETGLDIGPARLRVPSSATVVGEYHTHGDYSKLDPTTNQIVRTTSSEDEFRSDMFSETIDKPGVISRGNGVPEYKGYLGTPSGKFKVFDPLTGSVRTL